MSGKRLTQQEIKVLFDRISNWGRWGKDDQRGALNYITDAKRLAAAALVKTGEAISLALPLATVPAPDNPTPVTHLMIQSGHDAHLLPAPPPFTSDYLGIGTHGYANTHLDALCHMIWNGKLYNGFAASEVGSTGALKLAIDVARSGVISRGVLLDIPRLRKVPWLEIDQHIYPDELDAATREQGVSIQEGDVLLVRTGRSQRRKAQGGWSPEQGLAGLDAACLPWLHERKIAALGSDGVSDAMPFGYDEDWVSIHVCAIVMMGVHLIDNMDLDALAERAKALGRYEFQFMMAPLVALRATASPVNPIAVF
ncbi:MAG TPA: cyclase family protein [Candidatus Binataceae bacterium]